MKKIIFLFLLLVGFVGVLPADELWLGEVPYVNVSSDSNDNFVIKYETEKNEYFITLSDWLGDSKIILNNEQFGSLKETISKAIDWCKIAHENEVEVDKEIPNSKIEANVEWKWGVNRYRNAGWDKLNLKFRFSSLAGETKIVPLLLIAAPTITSSYSEDVTFRFPTALLSEKEINKFMRVISQENIDAAIKKNEESKKAEELFN